jgi:hypothetical protein
MSEAVSGVYQRAAMRPDLTPAQAIAEALRIIPQDFLKAESTNETSTAS